MKPRLPALPLTRTDWGIMVHLSARRGMSVENFLLYDVIGPDVRDAELMLTAQSWRFRGLGAITRYPTSSGDLVDCRGGMGWDFV